MASSLSRALVLVSSILNAWVFMGCAVDNRSLLEGDAGLGPGGAGGSGGAGGRSGAGGGEEDAGPSIRCSYPADDTNPDCQTLVANAGFHADVSHWTTELESVVLRWEEGDASSSEESGASVVTNTLFGTADGTASVGARQCLPARAGTRYIVAADVLVAGGFDQFQPDAAPPADNARAGISILFYEAADCQGPSAAQSFTSSLVEQIDAWQPVGGSKVAPEDTMSMAVRLVAMKPFRQFSMRAHFDNVLVRAR